MYWLHKSVWRLVGRMKNNAWWTNKTKRVGNEEKMLQNVEKKIHYRWSSVDKHSFCVAQACNSTEEVVLKTAPQNPSCHSIPAWCSAHNYDNTESDGHVTHLWASLLTSNTNINGEAGMRWQMATIWCSCLTTHSDSLNNSYQDS